jgi:CIC family chloride channel protein
MTKDFKRSGKDLFNTITESLHIDENTAIIIIASFIGIIGGFGAVGFRTLIEALQNITIGDHLHILQTVTDMPWQKRLLLPVAGGLLVGPIVYFWGRETKGHGVPEVMEAVALKGGKIRPRVMFLKTLVSAITISTGGSVGREGPIVQIGSSVGSALGQWLGMSQDKLKILVACGAAAGIAATFNAPIAGVMFSVEIILGSYALVTLVPLIMSSVMATIIGRWYFGDIPAFEIPHYELASGWEIFPYILLGIMTGVVAVGFVKLLYGLEDYADGIPIKGWLKTPLILFLVGLLVLQFPQVYGVGYDTITQVLKGEIVWYVLLLLLPIKMLATSITLAAGGSGGVFAPSLFLGAVFGGLFGTVMQFFFPELVVSSGAYAVVGMSAMVAGTTHAPITAFLIIFELTNDYKLILPIMICAILATFVASLLKKDSIYTMKLTRRGVDLTKTAEVSVMQTTTVQNVMDSHVVPLNENTGFNEILEKVIRADELCYYVIDDTGKFQGSFNVHDVKEILNEQTLAGLVVAKDLIPISVNPSIEINANLDQCLKKFSLYDAEEMAVVDSEATEKFIGRIGRKDIMNLYNREILRQGTSGLKFIQSKLADKPNAQKYVNLPDGFEISLIRVSSAIYMKTLQELDLRKKYSATVVAINRRTENGEWGVIVPDYLSSLKIGDKLVVMGRAEDLQRMKTDFDRNS